MKAFRLIFPAGQFRLTFITRAKSGFYFGHWDAKITQIKQEGERDVQAHVYRWKVSRKKYKPSTRWYEKWIFYFFISFSHISFRTIQARMVLRYCDKKLQLFWCSGPEGRKCEWRHDAGECRTSPSRSYGGAHNGDILLRVKVGEKTVKKRCAQIHAVSN